MGALSQGEMTIQLSNNQGKCIFCAHESGSQVLTFEISGLILNQNSKMLGPHVLGLTVMSLIWRGGVFLGQASATLVPPRSLFHVPQETQRASLGLVSGTGPPGRCPPTHHRSPSSCLLFPGPAGHTGLTLSH